MTLSSRICLFRVTCSCIWEGASSLVPSDKHHNDCLDEYGTGLLFPGGFLHGLRCSKCEVVGYVIHPDSWPIYLYPVQVVHCQNSAPLVLVAEKRKSFRLACLPAPQKANIPDFSILGEDIEDISFCQH